MTVSLTPALSERERGRRIAFGATFMATLPHEGGGGKESAPYVLGTPGGWRGLNGYGLEADLASDADTARRLQAEGEAYAAEGRYSEAERCFNGR